MDDVEKNIVRRRRADLYSDGFTVTRDVLSQLKSKGLLLQEHVTQVEHEKTNNAKVDRIVDAIIQLSPVDGFQNFCNIVSKFSATLAAEFEVELGLERGVIKPRQEMIDEASGLVNRKFAKSRRFSDEDRQEVVELIAAKLQLAHDEWRREADKVQSRLDKVRAETLSLDEQSARVAKLLANFTQSYDTAMIKHSDDQISTKQLLKKLSASKTEGAIPTMDQLLGNMKELFKQVEVILDRRDSLYNEKERCLRLLNITDVKVQLDDVVGKVTGLSITSNLGVERKDDIIARLESQSSELNSRADECDKEIEQLRRTLATKERELADLRHNVHID